MHFLKSSIKWGGVEEDSDVQLPKIHRITDFFEQLPNLDSLLPMQKFVLVEPASLPLRTLF